MKQHKKVTVFFILPLSCLIAAIYAIINDFLLYNFCPEFFTKFKFIEYGLASDASHIPSVYIQWPILGIIKVAVMASWWMGLIIGTTLTLLSLPLPTFRLRLSVLLKAMAITVAVTAVIAVLGLLYGHFFLSGHNRPVLLYLPQNLEYPDDFMMSFSLHNFSYFGAILGMFAASIFIIKKKRKLMMF